MPLTTSVDFEARIQKNLRIQIPVKIRWAYKLDPGEIFRVYLRVGYHSEDFYAAMSKDGRITIPKVIAEEYLDPGDPLNALASYTTDVTSYPVEERGKEEDE